MKTYLELRSINVSEHIERKNGLSYLSWTYALDELQKNDPGASWEFLEPIKCGDTVVVSTKVTAFGKTLPMQLAVLDHKNQAAKNPDASKISNSQMRCLTKNIACFGIGLYIYAGEDIPMDENSPKPKDENGYVEKPRAEPGTGIEPDYYIVDFGKYANRRIEEIDVKELRAYCEYLESEALKKKKPITGKVEKFLTEAYKYIDTAIQMGLFEDGDGSL